MGWSLLTKVRRTLKQNSNSDWTKGANRLLQACLSPITLAHSAKTKAQKWSKKEAAKNVVQNYICMQYVSHSGIIIRHRNINCT